VKPSPVWIEVALTPADAARLRAHPKVEGLFVRRADASAPLSVPAQAVRVVSLAPEIDPRTATVTAILELRLSASDLPFGTAAEADITLPGEGRGIAIPATAVVDDGGVPVAYVQLEGESFARREVRPRGRQGDVLAVEGLKEGERLVTRGGQAIRRASLLSTGAPEGHVH
jgi:multidrug efflux pump subunit AcrA (membrane-fusion protein)